jgi:hypothetical protein
VPAIKSGAATFSRAVRLGTRLKAWKTIPTEDRRYAVRSAPVSDVISVSTSARRSTIEPLVGVRIDAIAESSVVFPHPLAPSASTSSPSPISRHRWSSGRTR